MDPSNKNFSNLTNQDSPSFPEDSSQRSPPKQFPNSFCISQFPQNFNPQYFHNFYPFGSSSNCPPYGPAPPFHGVQQQTSWLQGLKLQQNLVHSPNQEFGAASNRAPFVAQHGTSGGAAANTSSHGSHSSIPQPTHDQHKQPITIEEASDSSEEGGKRAPRINWSEEENIRLAHAWLNNSVDSIEGNGNKGEYYWRDVANEFNNNRPTNSHKRTVKQLKSHWGGVKKDVTKFCGVYAQVKSTYTSGHSDDMIKDKAVRILV
jgi:hypothetical protein